MESLEKTLYIVRKYVSEEFKDKINVILCLFCKINEFWLFYRNIIYFIIKVHYNFSNIINNIFL